MPKESLQLKRRRLLLAKRVIDRLIKKEGFILKKQIKFGPRFFVAWGLKNNQPVVFKICLFTSSVDHLTNEKFSREILFLNFIQHASYLTIRKATSRLIAFGIKPRAWYVREFMTGKLQNIRGNVLFKPSFFKQSTLRFLIHFFYTLQSIRAHRLPNEFKNLLYPPDFTKHLMRFMNPHWQSVEKFIGQKGIAQAIINYFRKNSKIYNTAPRVLAHQEPYADHFFKKNGGFYLIDWENVGWSNPVHDIVIIWMRASSYPTWQNKLYGKFKEKRKGGTLFDQLWQIEVMIQSVFNIIGYYFYPYPKDLKELVSFSKKNILNILPDHYK